MFVRMELTERRTHKSSLAMMGAGLAGCALVFYAVRNLAEFSDATGRGLGAGFCLFLLWMIYAGVQRNVNAEMWRQADAYAAQMHWYLCDVCPVIDSRSKRNFLRITLDPGALNGFTQVQRRYIPETHPDFQWLSRLTEEDVAMRVPVRLVCIAPEILGSKQPERLFDLLRIHLS